MYLSAMCKAERSRNPWFVSFELFVIFFAQIWPFIPWHGPIIAKKSNVKLKQIQKMKVVQIILKNEDQK